MFKIISKKDKFNDEMYDVFINDEYSFSIAEEEYLSFALYEDKEFELEELLRIKRHAIFKKARSVALKFVVFKLRCEQEIIDKLKEEKFSDEIIRDVINDLSSLGYINDKIFIQKFLFDRSKLKPKSKKLLKLELLNKGLSSELLEEVLSDWELDEGSVAEGLIKKKFGKYDLNDEKVFKKAYSFLFHRGFSHQVIVEAIKLVKG